MEPMIFGIPAGVFVVLSVVVPTWLVYLGFESHILHLRNRWAYWVVGISLMVFAVLVRGDLAEFAHPLLGALMASAPLLFGRGTLARRVTLSAFGLVIVLPGDLFLDMTFDILAGATIGDHAKVAANATLFACATLFEVFVEITLFWGLTALVRRFYPEEGVDVAAPSSRRASVIASSFAVFSVVQAMLLALCFSVAVGPCDGDSLLLRLFGLLMLLCFGVDTVLLLAVGRFRGKVRDDARAADLSGELDRYLVDYQATVDMVQRSARLRHDLQPGSGGERPGRTRRARACRAAYRRHAEGAGRAIALRVERVRPAAGAERVPGSLIGRHAVAAAGRSAGWAPAPPRGSSDRALRCLLSLAFLCFHVRFRLLLADGASRGGQAGPRVVG